MKPVTVPAGGAQALTVVPAACKAPADPGAEPAIALGVPAPRAVRLARWPVALGLLGSVIMGAAGSGLSYVVGTGSLMSWWFSLPAGWSAHHAALLEGAYYLGLGTLTAAWGLLGRSLRAGDRSQVHILWWAAGLWSIPLLLAPIFLSTDLNSYLAQAAVIRAGLDPYLVGPAVLGHSSHLLALTAPNWRSVPSPYGPLFLGLASVVGAAAGSHLVLGIFGMRALAVGGLVVVACCVPRLAESLGADPVRATWLAVASPFVLAEFVSSGHNDIVMIAFILVGLTLRERGRPLFAVAACALAVMVKAPAVLALGLVAVAWAAEAAGWRARAARLAKSGLVGGGVMAGTSLAVGLGWGWLNPSTLTGATRLLFPTTPSNAVGAVAGVILKALGADVSLVGAMRSASLVGVGVAAVFAVAVLRRGERLGWSRSVGLCLMVFGLLSPIVWPWYLAWGFVVLACVRPTQSSKGLVVMAVVTELVFGPVAVPGGMLSVLVMTLAACCVAPYALSWSRRHLLGQLPPRSGTHDEPLQVPAAPSRPRMLPSLSNQTP